MPVTPDCSAIRPITSPALDRLVRQAPQGIEASETGVTHQAAREEVGPQSRGQWPLSSFASFPFSPKIGGAFPLMKLVASLAFLIISVSVFAVEPVAIGSRRELFVDRLLVGELKNATLKLHEPILAEPLAKDARPNGHYATVLKAEN